MWNTLDDFTAWYIENNHPLKPPADEIIYDTGFGLNSIIFRQAQFQVELVLVKPLQSFTDIQPKNGVDQRVIFLNGTLAGFRNGTALYDSSMVKDKNQDGTSVLFNRVFKPGEEKIDDLRSGISGAAFLSVQKWDDNLVPTSLAKYKNILI